MQTEFDICIIGNGAIGKTAALGFAESGLNVALLSPPSDAEGARSSLMDWDVRVYALNHVARDLLSSVGVWDALDGARVAAVDAMQVNGDGGDGVAGAGRLSFDAYGARAGALAWIVEDGNLNRALDTGLKFAPRVRCMSGRAIRIHTGGKSVSVELESGDSVGAKLLVGADGGQSWVRGQCDIGVDYRSYGQRAIVTNFECERPHQGAAHQWFCAEQGVVALLPLSGRRVSLVWSAPDALVEILLRESLTQLADRLAAWAGPALGGLRPLQPEAVKSFALTSVRPHAMTAARVALVGDAAHVVHPLAGQGMNLGFADVTELLKMVAGRGEERDCGDARVLSRYARARKEDVLLMQLTTDGLVRLFASEVEPVRVLRNLGLNLLDRLPVLKRSLISQALGRSQ